MPRRARDHSRDCHERDRWKNDQEAEDDHQASCGSHPIQQGSDVGTIERSSRSDHEGEIGDSERGHEAEHESTDRRVVGVHFYWAVTSGGP